MIVCFCSQTERGYSFPVGPGIVLNISDMKESLAYVALDFDAELYAARHNLSPLQAARRRLAFVAAASRHLDHDMLAAVCSMICGVVPVLGPAVQQRSGDWLRGDLLRGQS